MIPEIRNALNRLICFFLYHQPIVYGPIIWVNLTADDSGSPAQKAICCRCHWRGYRTTWGQLVHGRVQI